MCGRHQDGWTPENVGVVWNVLRKEIDLEDPSPLLNQFFWVTTREKQKLITDLTKRKQTPSDTSPSMK